MADLTDVTAYLRHATAAAVYPNGSTQPSVAGMDVRIFEGWPTPAQLDLDVAGQMLSPGPPPQKPIPRPGGPCAEVSIFPMTGTSSPAVYQILDETYLIIPPAYGITIGSFDQNGGTINFTGAPTATEYLTLVVNTRDVFSRTGPDLATIISELAADAVAIYPGVTFTATSITLPNLHALEVRQGAMGTLGKVTWRQKHAVMITTWAPTPDARKTIAKQIDNIIKRDLVVEMPDTTQALITYSRTMTSDEMQTQTIYRRDLIYEVEYATLWEFPGYVVTSVTINIAGGEWSPPQVPLTVPAII